MSAYEISDDPALLDRDAVHRWLSGESYWARGRAREVTERAIAGSVVLGAYARDGTQAAFARVVTDRATFAWLCDVFVDAAHRGRGLGTRIVAAALEHPELQGLRWVLATADAHGLYERFGFQPVEAARWMERPRP